jgi:hypothetical protein
MSKTWIVTTAAAVSIAAGQETFERRIEHKIVAGPGDGAGALLFQRGAPSGDVTVRLGGAGQTFEFVGMEMISAGPVVKGAPYSAEAITESVQTLADGNRITHRQTAQLYRDSEGRTRREERFGPRGEIVLINDPAGGFHYVLNPETRTAQKIALPAAGAIAASGSTGAMVRRGPMPRSGEAVVAEVRGGLVSAGRLRSEPLGKRIIEGVEAEGTRSIRTIAAGEIGNERAIEIVTERWYSNELQMVVLTRTTDPRSGETTFRIANLQRGEPMRSLFEAPADYTVKESEGALRVIQKIDAEKK